MNNVNLVLLFSPTLKNQLMKNFKLLSFTWLSTLFIFVACTKQNASPSVNNGNSQNINAGVQTFTFNDVTIDASDNHVFSIPAITQDIIDRGSVTVYATNSADAAQWSALPIMNGCDFHLDVTSSAVGKVEIQNNLGASVTMSYRFDIVAAQ
jgi:hypothetical protein